MNTYDVTLKDEMTYLIEANTQGEAINKALNLWQVRTPSINAVKEKKKVKKIVHYTKKIYFTQEVLVNEDMDEDEILDLWNKDEIKTLNNPVFIDEEYAEGSAWVK